MTGMLATGVILVVGASPAHALGARASLAAGVVNVSGHAEKSAQISWEGVAVTTANKGGGFAFTTNILPADCIGTLSDGATSVDVRIDGCSTGTTGLPGTGQTTIYAPGDDGDIQAGGPLSYTDNGNGTVTDNRSGLTWEQKSDANVNILLTWQEALDYVAQLNAMNGGAGFAGHNDWRMPNIKELISIVDYGRFNPAIDPIFGPTTGLIGNNYFYWSSTSRAAFYPEVNAWAIEFKDTYESPSGVRPLGKASYSRVRAVRGGL